MPLGLLEPATVAHEIARDAISDRVALVVGALALVNLFAFAQMALDKSAARRAARRIPERRLIAPAYVGGAPGVWLAMSLLRHKTRKPGFQVRLAFAALVSLALAGIVVASLRR